MIKKMKIVFTGLVVVVLSSLQWVIAQNTPDWASQLPNIPELEGYYQGLGIAESSGDINEDWEKAINRARANLISQIEVHIVSEMTSWIIETEESGNFKVESYFDEHILASSQLMLQEVPVRRWYDHDSEIYYAYMVIPFSYVDDIRRNYLSNAESVYDFYSMLANEFTEKGELYSGLLIYFEGLKNLMEIRQNIEKVGMQDQTTYDIGQLSLRYENLICDLFDRIEIISKSSEIQALDSQGSYPGYLEGEVIYIDHNKNNIPVTSQFPLKAEPLGHFEANLNLTQRGERYFLHIEKIIAAGEFNEVELSILPDHFQIMGDIPSLAACKQHLERKESVNVKGKKNTRIVIYIEEIENGTHTGKHTVVDALRSELAGKGFIVETGEEYYCAGLDMSVDGFLVCGEIHIDDRSNPRPNFYFATAGGNIEIIDAHKNSALGIIQTGEIREGGNRYQQARTHSLHVLSQQIVGKVSDFFEERFNNVTH